jgi:hypothetical protein
VVAPATWRKGREGEAPVDLKGKRHAGWARREGAVDGVSDGMGGQLGENQRNEEIGKGFQWWRGVWELAPVGGRRTLMCGRAA